MLTAHPTSKVAQKVEQRRTQEKLNRRIWPAAAGSVAVVLALVVVLLLVSAYDCAAPSVACAVDADPAFPQRPSLLLLLLLLSLGRFRGSRALRRHEHDATRPNPPPRLSHVAASTHAHGSDVQGRVERCPRAVAAAKRRSSLEVLSRRSALPDNSDPLRSLAGLPAWSTSAHSTPSSPPPPAQTG